MSIVDYIRETKAEMRHVVWPTWAQTFLSTVAVIFISIFVALVLAASDSVFSVVIKNLIGAQ